MVMSISAAEMATYRISPDLTGGGSHFPENIIFYVVTIDFLGG